jgi:hypothetical protein
MRIAIFCGYSAQNPIREVAGGSKPPPYDIIIRSAIISNLQDLYYKRLMDHNDP